MGMKKSEWHIRFACNFVFKKRQKSPEIWVKSISCYRSSSSVLLANVYLNWENVGSPFFMN